MDKLIGKIVRITKKNFENKILYDFVIKILPSTNDIMYFNIKIIHIYTDKTGICARMVKQGLGKESMISNFIESFIEKGKLEHSLDEYKIIINEPLSEKINKILSL